jgi:hypothetical protein
VSHSDASLGYTVTSTKTCSITRCTNTNGNEWPKGDGPLGATGTLERTLASARPDSSFRPIVSYAECVSRNSPERDFFNTIDPKRQLAGTVLRRSFML